MSRISEGGRNYSLLSRPGVQEALDELFDSQGIADAGREFVLQAFRKPARRVGDRPGRGGSNVLVFYISWKMGIVIQCESRTVEHAFVELNEFDPEVLYYLHQPGRLYVTRRNVKGREVGNWCTPDYLVVRQGEICLVECKPVSQLRGAGRRLKKLQRRWALGSGSFLLKRSIRPGTGTCGFLRTFSKRTVRMPSLPRC